jgi:predicted nucleic acid-binding Zn ribbon protein
VSLTTTRCASSQCANDFVPTKPWQKFCSTKCRMIDANRRRHEGLKLLGQYVAGALVPVAATGAST